MKISVDPGIATWLRRLAVLGFCHFLCSAGFYWLAWLEFLHVEIGPLFRWIAIILLPIILPVVCLINMSGESDPVRVTVVLLINSSIWALVLASIWTWLANWFK